MHFKTIKIIVANLDVQFSNMIENTTIQSFSLAEHCGLSAEYCASVYTKSAMNSPSLALALLLYGQTDKLKPSCILLCLNELFNVVDRQRLLFTIFLLCTTSLRSFSFSFLGGNSLGHRVNLGDLVNTTRHCPLSYVPVGTIVGVMPIAEIHLYTILNVQKIPDL